MRGADATLAAVEGIGGGWALALRGEAAACCLALWLKEAVAGSCRPYLHVEHRLRVAVAFEQLGPRLLPDAAAEVLQGMPGSPQRALASARLTESLLLAHARGVDGTGRRYAQLMAQKQVRHDSTLCAATHRQAQRQFWHPL
jgi:hypothetical protein